MLIRNLSLDWGQISQIEIADIDDEKTRKFIRDYLGNDGSLYLATLGSRPSAKSVYGVTTNK